MSPSNHLLCVIVTGTFICDSCILVNPHSFSWTLALNFALMIRSFHWLFRMSLGTHWYSVAFIFFTLGACTRSETRINSSPTFFPWTHYKPYPDYSYRISDVYTVVFPTRGSCLVITRKQWTFDFTRFHFCFLRSGVCPTMIYFVYIKFNCSHPSCHLITVV